MDGLTLYKIYNLLQNKLLNAALNKLIFLDNAALAIFYNDNKTFNIKFVLSGSATAVYPIEKYSSTVGKEIKAVSGSKITHLRTNKYDRILFIDLSKRKPSGKIIQYSLVFEMVNGRSNCMVLNDRNIIYDKHNNNNVDQDRSVSIGSAYIPFKANKEHNLDSTGNAAGFNDLTGFYVVTANHANILLQNMSSFYKTCMQIRNDLENDDLFYIDQNDKLIPFEIINYKKVLTFSTLSEFYNRKIESDNVLTKKNRLLSFYRKRCSKYHTLLLNLQKELQLSQDYKSFHQEAILLKNNYNLLKTKRGKISLNKYSEDDIISVDYYLEKGIDVDKKISELFNKSKKLERGVYKIQERIDVTKGILQSIDDQIYYIEELNNKNELENLYYDLFHKKTKTKEKDSLKPFMEIVKDQCTYYIGRNSASNQILVSSFANGNDYWFHAHETPSAHVIMRKNEEVLTEDIVFGARITAYFSKYRDQKKIDIDYTLKKYVKSPKKSPPGSVIYKNYKSIYVIPFTKDFIESALARSSVE